MNKTPRLNYEMFIVCKDCGAQFHCLNPDPSLEILPGETRVALAHFPNACPDCHNIRPVQTTKPDEETPDGVA